MDMDIPLGRSFIRIEKTPVTNCYGKWTKFPHSIPHVDSVIMHKNCNDKNRSLFAWRRSCGDFERRFFFFVTVGERDVYTGGDQLLESVVFRSSGITKTTS